ncbi:MAG: MBL fold metallo-hydrolase [Pirellulales bacterium]
MIHNLPVKTLRHDELTIEGYSRAAVQTYWRIPELKIGFDLGAQPWSFMGTGTWFVSHAHLDHIAALPLYIARRRMMKMDPPTIYLPASTLDPVRQILRQFTRLDRGRFPCQLEAVQPGDEIALSREHVVTVSATTHSVPSHGFVVWHRRRKLKAELSDLTGDQIRALRLAGTEVTEEHREPIVAYLGDSSPEGLDRCDAMYRPDLLILEMTFIAPSHRKDKIHKCGHMHLDDIVARRDRFENQRIIASHFSTRYGARQIRQMVAHAIPDMLDDRLYLWL